MHPFDRALILGGSDECAVGNTSADYANMVGPFGGVTAATMLRAIERRSDVLGEPLSLTVNFLGPIADGAFAIVVRCVRTNRSTQHWYAEFTQGGISMATATAVFGLRRPTWGHAEPDAPWVAFPEDYDVLDFPAGIAWLQNYEIRFVSGGLADIDGIARERSETIQWIRDKPARAIDFAALAALSDSFYPRIYRRLGRMLPAGTVSLTTYFHADGASLAAQQSEPILGVARGQSFGLGFFDQAACLWGRDETLLATSHQLVYFKT